MFSITFACVFCFWYAGTPCCSVLFAHSTGEDSFEARRISSDIFCFVVNRVGAFCGFTSAALARGGNKVCVCFCAAVFAAPCSRRPLFWVCVCFESRLMLCCMQKAAFLSVGFSCVECAETELTLESACSFRTKSGYYYYYCRLLLVIVPDINYHCRSPR